jgi:NodT family efflux transporter outer membrane factor (OMF) lipoprotein
MRLSMKGNGEDKGRMGHAVELSGFFPACLIATVMSLSGCITVGPDFIQPDGPVAEGWMEREALPIKSTPAELSSWWEVFGDPVLDELIEDACSQNLPLRIAGVRILEARARLGIATGERYPQLQQAAGAFTRGSLSESTANSTPSADFTFGEINLGFDAAWELDFWGKFRRGIEAGIGDLAASIAGFDDILVSLTAEVARTYVQVRTLEARLSVARENVTLQDRSLRIAEAQYSGGMVTELDVQQARSLLKDTQSTIPVLEANLRQAKNALALLLGELPGSIDGLLSEAKPIPTPPAEIAVGVPAELLRRRPDIRLAEQQVAAQSARIGVAKADLYPHFSLFGSIGLRASDASVTAKGYPGGSEFSDLFDYDSIEWFAGPSVSWDLLNYGRITNRVRVQDARLQELIVNYRDTLLRAAQEVEDAMAAFLGAQEQTGFLADGAHAAERSVDLSLLQYKEGLVDYQRVIDTQRFLSIEQDRLTEATGSIAVNLIAMYKALGGGWQIRQGKGFVPEETTEEMRARTNWGDLVEQDQLEPAVDKSRKKRWWWPDW